MKSDATVIKHLNKALANELIAINQYFLHSRMYQDWGLEKLAAKEHEESIDEMKHADQLIQRILFLHQLELLRRIQDQIPFLQDVIQAIYSRNSLQTLIVFFRKGNYKLVRQ